MRRSRCNDFAQHRLFLEQSLGDFSPPSFPTALFSTERRRFHLQTRAMHGLSEKSIRPQVDTLGVQQSYPVAMNTKINGALITYRHSAKQYLQNAISRAANVNNL
jgi:hypothetical protein